MQESLVVALADGSVPGFTVSYGVTDTTQTVTLEELCRIADGALFRAEARGARSCSSPTSTQVDLLDAPVP